MSRITKIKTVFEDDIRLFKLLNENIEDAYEAVNGFIVSSYGFSNKESFTLTYKDEEGDLITIVSSTDLKDAIQEVKDLGAKSLKIFVKLAPKKNIRQHQQPRYERKEEAAYEHKEDNNANINFGVPPMIEKIVKDIKENKNEIISFLTEVVVLYQSSKGEDLTTCIVTALSTHPTIAEHELFKQFVAPMIPLVVSKGEAVAKDFLLKLDTSKIADFVGSKIDKLEEFAKSGFNCGVFNFGSGCPLGGMLPMLPMMFMGMPPCGQFKQFGKFGGCRRKFGGHGCGRRKFSGRKHCGRRFMHHMHHMNHMNNNTAKLESDNNLRCDIIENIVPMVANTQVDPSQGIIKKWKMKNVGKIDLPANLLVKYSGRRNNPMVQCKQFYIGNTNPIKPGEEFIVYVSISTPEYYGSFNSNWRLINPKNGKKFGEKLSFRLVLHNPSNPHIEETEKEEKEKEIKKVDEEVIPPPAQPEPVKVKVEEVIESKPEPRLIDLIHDKDAVISSTIVSNNGNDNDVKEDINDDDFSNISSMDSVVSINDDDNDDMVIDTEEPEPQPEPEPVQEQEQEPKEEEYEYSNELKQLEAMGFKNQQELLKSLLSSKKGDVEQVIALLF